MKIEKIEIESGAEYNGLNYPKPGFYEVNSMLYIVDDLMLVWSVGNVNNFQFLQTKEQKQKSDIPSVSESFALKMLAIATSNNDAIKEL